MILPNEGFRGDSQSEEKLWALFKKELPEDIVSFHGYNIEARKPDIIMLIPSKGVLIIENKGFHADKIKAVPDNQRILLQNTYKTQEASPMKKADEFCCVFRNRILAPNNLNQVYVVPAVAWPEISEQEFFTTHLDKISNRIFTFLREDLIDRKSILNRIEEIFSIFCTQVDVSTAHKGGLYYDLLERIGNLISNDFRNSVTFNVPPDPIVSESPVTHTVSDNEDNNENIGEYSVLIYDGQGVSFEDENQLADLAKLWLNGTRLFLYTMSPDAFNVVTKYFSNVVDKECLPGTFSIKKGRSFRLEIGLVRNLEEKAYEYFEIKSGIGYDEKIKELKWLDQISDFNLGQYEMEHAPCTNIVVTAGAGTGKTHSMISRINYLIWKHNVAPEKLSRFIVMITFTVKSADEMRNRLTQNFMQYFLLTKNQRYLELLESLADVNISTIHSLCRTVLKKYSSRLGFGNGLKIGTGKYRRKEILREEVNNWLSSLNNDSERSKMKLYFLQKNLCDLLGKIDNKNVDLVYDYDQLDFGSGNNCLPTGLIDTLVNTQRRLDQEMLEDNTVCLGDLIRKMKQLTLFISESDFTNDNRIEYLFVDEFQDTDNVQIELIRNYQRLVHFKYFVVGDTKQCIYRFRGADDEAFDVLKRDSGEDIYPTIHLRKNYRTDIGLLQQMNTVFQQWDRQGLLDYSGDDILGGVIHEEVDNAFIRLVGNGIENDEQQFVNVLKEAIDAANEINERKGLKGDKKKRAAVLVRERWQADKVLEICKRYKIPIGSDMGGQLFSSNPIIDLYKLVMALRYPEELEYLIGMYTTSYVPMNLDKDALFRIRKDEQLTYIKWDFQMNGFDFDKHVDDLRDQPVLKVLQDIIDECKPSKNFASKSGDEERREHLEKYYLNNLNQVIENLTIDSNTDYFTINKLVDYLEIMIMTHQQEEERESFEGISNDDTLICTTVHKSKGLEFDTVILPFCDFQIQNTINKGTVDVIYEHPKVAYRIAQHDIVNDSPKKKKENAYSNDYYSELSEKENDSKKKEETRILYVAMTRAERKFVCFKSAKKNGLLTWGKLIGEA